MRNRKGFTLVELLVTIAILGIIMGMSIPLINNIRSRLEYQKYVTYGKSVLSSAKVYINDYSNDLFGYHNSGCSFVSLDELIRKRLIEDFPDSKISCNDSNTKVKIVKIGKQYGYSYDLFCGQVSDTSNFKKVYSFNSKRTTTCDGKDSSVSIDPVNKNNKLAERHSEKIRLTSITGIKFNSLNISYSWVKAEDLESINVTDSNIEWKPLVFRNNISESKQKDMIFNKGEQVKIISESVTTPSVDEPTTFALVLKVNSLKNLAMDDLVIEEAIESNYKVFGLYRVGKKYEVKYDSNGGEACNPSSVFVLQDKGNSKTLEGVDLCSPVKDNNIFKEWNTKIDGTGNRIDNSSIITNNITVYAQWVPKTSEKITFKIQLDNSDHITEKTTGDNGTSYTWGRNGNILTRQVGKGAVSDFTYTLLKGKNVTMDLPNYNYSKYINISRNYNTADGDVAWKCVSGCKNKNQVLSQYSTAIKDTSEIFNSNNVVIKVNWRQTKAKIRVKVFNHDYSPYEKLNTNTAGKFKLSSGGYVVNSNGSDIMHEISYNNIIGENGLVNYNNSNWLDITRDYRLGISGKEWKCVSGDCTHNNTYNQNKTDYKATDFCSDSVLKVRDCTADLAVNWRMTQVRLKFKVFTNDYSPYEKLSVDIGGILNSDGYIVRRTSSVDYFQAIPYGKAIGDIYNYGLLNYNNPGYIVITRDYHTAVKGEEWKCISGDCTRGTKYNHTNRNYKSTDFCSASVLKVRDCTANLAVNWRKNKLYINYHLNGGKFKAGNSNQGNTSNNYAGVSGTFITGGNDKNGNGGTRDFFAYDYDSNVNDNSNNGLLDVKNRGYAYIEHDNTSLTTPKSGFTWNCSKDGSGKSFNQCYPSYEYTNNTKCPSNSGKHGCPYIAKDTTGLEHPQCYGVSTKGPYTPAYIVGQCNSSCSLAKSDCRVILYVRWVKK